MAAENVPAENISASKLRSQAMSDLLRFSKEGETARVIVILSNTDLVLDANSADAKVPLLHSMSPITF